MIEAKNIEGSYLEYKGRPLVRQGDDIYYGDMAGHHVYMMILNRKVDYKGEEVPGTIVVQLLEGKMPKKQTTVNGLSEAFEFACAWLDRT